MKASLIWAAFLAMVVATGIVACSSRPTDQTPPPSESASGGEHTGEVGYELRLGRTTHINKASYTVTCPGGFAQSGTIDVSKLRELEGSIPNLPPGGPCTLTLTANSTNGNVSCSGSKSGLTVTCPGDRPQDETHLKLVCTRNHVGVGRRRLEGERANVPARRGGESGVRDAGRRRRRLRPEDVVPGGRQLRGNPRRLRRRGQLRKQLPGR